MKFIKSYFLVILTYLIFLILCVLPSNELPKIEILNFDKFEHFLMGFFLSILGVFIYSQKFKKRRPLFGIVCISFIIPILFGGLIEIVQLTLSIGRTGCWYDFLFDTIGSFIGALVCFCINYRQKRRKKA